MKIEFLLETDLNSMSKPNLIIFKLDGLLHDCALTADGTMIGNSYQFDCPAYDYLLPDQILFAEYDQQNHSSTFVRSFSIAHKEKPCTVKDAIERSEMQALVKHLFETIKNDN